MTGPQTEEEVKSMNIEIEQLSKKISRVGTGCVIVLNLDEAQALLDVLQSSQQEVKRLKDIVTERTESRIRLQGIVDWMDAHHCTSEEAISGIDAAVHKAFGSLKETA